MLRKERLQWWKFHQELHWKHHFLFLLCWWIKQVILYIELMYPRGSSGHFCNILFCNYSIFIIKIKNCLWRQPSKANSISCVYYLLKSCFLPWGSEKSTAIPLPYETRFLLFALEIGLEDSKPCIRKSSMRTLKSTTFPSTCF